MVDNENFDNEGVNVEENLNRNTLLTAKDVADARIVNSTKVTYKSKLNQFYIWLKSNNHHDYIIESTKTINIPIPDDIILSFMGDIKTHSNGKFKVSSTIGGYWNSIESLHMSASVPISNTLLVEKKKFNAGMKRLIANDKQSGLMSNTEGKSPLDFTAYKLLAMKTLNIQRSYESTSPFSHLYLVLQWNIMKRSASVADCNFNNILWSDDCLIVKIFKEKNNQDGDKNKCIDIHVYANPTCPAICPVLALGLHVLTLPNISKDWKTFSLLRK
mmetsp:Transcript_10732/g.9666  ORF Transcript_10732/g.9666 Transcript_10732/m.9666 type:complete len:273 (+) Transcript_10732:48-866(+)